jgi:adenylate kinase
LTQRTDDHAEVVKERLRAYHETADPLASYYRDRGLLQAIDGDRDAETVKMAVMNAVAAIRSGDISSQAQLGGR